MTRPGDAAELLTARRVRALLDAHGLAPTKRHGQNFVVDPNTVRKVVRDAGVEPGDRVVEVGPGLGSLTLALRQAGADVIAVEIDRGLADVLAEVVDDGVRIVRADALSVDYPALVATPAKLVANLPYNVATPIVVTALRSHVFTRLHVMVQREVGERWCAAPGSPRYGAVSVKLAALAGTSIVARVPRSAFYPVPRVDSVTVALTPHATPPGDEATLFPLVEAGFGQRRKRLRNSLSSPDLAPAEVERALEAAGLDPGARAEELGLDEWRRLRSRLPD